MRQRPPRQHKYSKDETEKDLYPWLDEKDHRRHMTDKEVLEIIIDLSEVCITEKQKQALLKILLKTEKLSYLRMKLDYLQICR